MTLYSGYLFCPCCGREYGQESFRASEVCLVCSHCSYVFYQNSIPSSATVVPLKGQPDEILMITRGTEPNSGKLALPGGILKYGEDPAEGARREVGEETLLDVAIDRLLCANLVDYLYLGRHVSVLELAFLALPIDADLRGKQTEEATAMGYLKTDLLLDEPSLLAFPEQLRVLESYSDCLRQGFALRAVS